MRLVATDNETCLIAPGRVVPPLVCSTFCEQGQEPTIHHVKGDATQKWLSLIKDPDVLLIGHNIPYDLATSLDACEDKEDALRAVFNALEHGRIRDCLIRQKIFHIRRGDLQFLKKGTLGLGDLSKLYLSEEMLKGEDTFRLRYSEFLDVTDFAFWPEAAKHYAKHDARQTLKVFLAQHELFTKMKYLGKEPYTCPDEVFQLKAAWALHLMSAWGIRTDPEKVAALEKTLLQEIDHHTKILQKAKIIRLNGSQNMEVLERRIVEVYQTLGKPFPLTAGAADPKNKGKPATDFVSTSKATIEAVAHLDPILTAVHERKHSEKILNTFLVPAKLGTVQPLTASFNVLLASTRTSCSGGKIDKKPNGTNLQNVPKKEGVRECFVPRKGNVFVDADYSTLEMRTFAQILYELKLPDILRQALIAKKDPHCMLGATLMRSPYDEFLTRYKSGDEDADAVRSLSKVGNFGYMGGLGPLKFTDYVKQFGIVIDFNRAKEIKNGWLATWQTQGYFNWVNSLISEDTGKGSVTFSSGVIRGNCSYTVAANSPFQSRAAYGAKEALWNLAKEMYLDRSSDLYGSRNVNFIHDENLLEAPEEHAHFVAVRVKKVMEESMMVWTPDVPQKVDPVLMRWWDKKAKPIVDEEGHLLPWGDDQEAA